MRLTGLWWWIDRWRKSTAYTDMTLEEQGAYRNLLDEATLRGGPIPNDERVLAKASGDAKRWARVRRAVLARFTLTHDGWRNETLDSVLAQSLRRATNQANYRNRLRAGSNGAANAADNGRDNRTDNNRHNKAASPDPDPDLRTRNPPTPLSAKGGRLTRRDLQEAKEIRSRAHGGCRHHPRCATFDACVRLIAQERKVKAS